MMTILLSIVGLTAGAEIIVGLIKIIELTVRTFVY